MPFAITIKERGRKLFKKLLLAFCVLCVLSSVHAAVFLIEPVDKKLGNNEEAAFGQIARGETLRVIVNKKSENTLPWDTIKVDGASLPEGWSAKETATDKSLIAEITAPRNAPPSTQRARFVVSNAAQPLFSEGFYGNFLLRENLLAISPENLQQETFVGKGVSFRLKVNNDSIAEHSLEVTSSLPGYWFEPVSLTLQPKEKKSIDLNVNVFSYGERNFSFLVSSKKNDLAIAFPAKLTIKPTLEGKYTASLFGFPFFSPSLLPNYLINAFAALLSFG